MLVKRLGLWLGVILALAGCASGDSSTGAVTPGEGGAAGVGGSESGSDGANGAGHAGTSAGGTSTGGTSAGGTSAGGTAGDAGAAGSGGTGATTAGGSSGSGGTAGTTQGDAQLCVLNTEPPQGTCDASGTLDFGTIGSGTTPMRLFRIDNKSTAVAKFTAVTSADASLSIKVVRYETDPGDPGNLLRIESTLPVVRNPDAALYFEVTFTGSTAGPVPSDPVVVTYKIGTGDDETISVPVVGEVSACPSGFGACDSDPNNGCETDITASLQHCGGCNMPCAPANGTGACNDSVCEILSCTLPFADCDGDVNNGCEANLLTTIGTCGSCETSCVKSSTVPICLGGHCDVSTCAVGFADCNLDVNGYDGCEVNVTNDLNNCSQCNISCDQAHMTGEACVNSACVPGTCDAGFADCNGLSSDGCEADTNNDAQHCGGCGQQNNCFFAHAGASCTNATCTIGACVGAYLDCNGDAGDGCEVNSDTSPTHCGACDNDCNDTIVHANTSCTTGTCGLVSCKNGYIDLNNNPADGCEYQCTVTSAVDDPDDSFVDANCDGIDGVISEGIFVATGGSDSNPGTKAQPVLTINAGIAKATASGKTKLFVSDGTYDGRVTLGNGISIYGGYSASNNWARSAAYVTKITSNAVDGGRVTALDGANIIVPTTIDRITVTTGSATGNSISNYGLYCSNCGQLTVKNSNITAGAGSIGTGGSNGSPGAGGGNGSTGGGGTCDTNTSGAPGGPGGTSTCGRAGGNGGQGGNYGSNSGATGGVGTGGTPGGGGGGGGSTGQPGAVGGTGATGGNGGNGTSGSGGSGAGGFWLSAAGGGGSLGNGGNGGGGGGGGGGQGCFTCDDGNGNGGGGGGAGGCPGTGAPGGTGGGGSFGLFLYNSTGIVLTNNNITSSSGGAGGAGGNGGSGGNGGGGAAGGQVCTGEVGGGGTGGSGGKGGNGGHGGGGAGGPSYAVFFASTAGSTAGNNLTAGPGGSGGASLGNFGATGASAQHN